MKYNHAAYASHVLTNLTIQIRSTNSSVILTPAQTHREKCRCVWLSVCICVIVSVVGDNKDYIVVIFFTNNSISTHFVIVLLYHIISFYEFHQRFTRSLSSPFNNEIISLTAFDCCLQTICCIPNHVFIQRENQSGREHFEMLMGRLHLCC